MIKLLQNRPSIVGALRSVEACWPARRAYGADVVEWLVKLWPKLWPDWRLASASDGGGLVAEQPRGCAASTTRNAAPWPRRAAGRGLVAASTIMCCEDEPPPPLQVQQVDT
eukprot:scaffold104638_cov69-Phaeocystis_antarctica.AAC.7